MAGDPSGRPGRLEVEPAGYSVDVQNFAGKIESGASPAFHRFEIHFRQRDSATRHEFIFVQALAADGQFASPQNFHEPVLAGPPSGWYRLRTGVRRHRVLVSPGLLVALSLVAGAARAASGYLTAKEREQDALKQKAAAIAAR